MSIINTITTVIGLVDKALGLMPNYKQKKKEKWIKLKSEYLKQINLEISKRDADLILNLRDSILLFAKDLAEEKE